MSQDIGETTRRELSVALLNTANLVRETAHLLFDEYQFDEARELQQLVEKIQGIQSKYRW